ncbi:MAG: hypothetical protein ACRER8_22205 [Pseudomonas sp.]|uniref:hypothetical protein n=1 Tax=Pseudomonas sp. TaxID=306 RepID=UPI003D6FA6EA
MIPKLVTALYAILTKPNASAGSQLIASRRICRAWTSVRNEIGHQRRGYQRAAEKMRRSPPYAMSDLELLEDFAYSYRKEEMDEAQASLVRFGYAMANDGSGVAASLGFDRLCDILNVNPVERAAIHPLRRKTLRNLIFDARVEDSADIKNIYWASGGPLCEAFYAAYCDELLQKTLRGMQYQQTPPQASQAAPSTGEAGPLSVYSAALVMIH